MAGPKSFLVNFDSFHCDPDPTPRKMKLMKHVYVLQMNTYKDETVQKILEVLVLNLTKGTKNLACVLQFSSHFCTHPVSCFNVRQVLQAIDKGKKQSAK